MSKVFSWLQNSLEEFTPKSWICFKEGYSSHFFGSDLLAGITIGIISLPLAMAFAIASGVPPEKGLFTGIVAGFLISLLGGSRVQIGGPTGAFVVIVFSIVERHGYEGLALATIMGGILMILMAFLRAGVLLKFIPFSVMTGLTAGIALSLFSSQMKDFFGLPIGKLPADFLHKWEAYFNHSAFWNPWAVAIGFSSLALIFIMRFYFPRLPGAIFAVVLSTAFVYFFDIPVSTIFSTYGAIPTSLPSPSLPFFSWDHIQLMFPDAITIAILGSIESLLSAVIADGMTGHRHKSNTELFAQGLANIGSIIFGGIPATGAIARTTANIKLGARTPLAGCIHAITLFCLMAIFAPLAAMIPLPTLAGVLIFVAWNMSEIPHVISISKGPKSDFFILLITFLLTVLIDLTVAVQVGVVLAAILFLKKMTDKTSVKICELIVKEEAAKSTPDSDFIIKEDVPEEVTIFEINGPLFYGVAYSLNELLRQLKPLPKIIIVRMHKVSLIDASGLHALEEFAKTCQKNKIILFVSGVKVDQRALLHKTGLEKLLGTDQLYSHFHEALSQTKKITQEWTQNEQPA